MLPKSSVTYKLSASPKISVKYPLTRPVVRDIDTPTATCVQMKSLPTTTSTPMTPYDPTQAAGQEALEILRLMITDDDVSDASRVSAAKTLLERFMPKDDAELERREADERTAAIAEARCLLAELAAAASPCPDQPNAVAENSATGTDYATEHAAK